MTLAQISAPCMLHVGSLSSTLSHRSELINAAALNCDTVTSWPAVVILRGFVLLVTQAAFLGQSSTRCI